MSWSPAWHHFAVGLGYASGVLVAYVIVRHELGRREGRHP